MTFDCSTLVLLRSVQPDFALQIVTLPFSQAAKLITIHVEQLAEIFVGQMMLTKKHSLHDYQRLTSDKCRLGLRTILCYTDGTRMQRNLLAFSIFILALYRDANSFYSASA